MSRERYIRRNGEWIRLVDRQPRPRVAIIGDTHEPFKSMADGQMYDSKSRYRAECRARGFQEVGNDLEVKAPQSNHGNVERDVAQALAERGL